MQFYSASKLYCVYNVMALTEGVERVIIRMAVDSTQRKAVSVLKKLMVGLVVLSLAVS